MTFVEGYKLYAIPRLRPLADSLGRQVWDGDIGFPEAHAEVMHQAIQFGAARLPEPRRWDLSRWVSDRIMRAAQALDVTTDLDAWDWDWC